MQVGFKSDKGLRRDNNEDACFILPKENVYVIADGVGGGNAGEIASRTAVKEIANYIKDTPANDLEDKYQIVEYLHDCLTNANKKIYTLSNTYEKNKGMATTAIIFFARKGKAYVANVGDSRVYIFRGEKLSQLTEDHTYVNTLVKAGILSKEQAEVDERKNMITRALGAEYTVEPDFFQLDVVEGDIFIICTDGLYDEVGKSEIINIVKKEESMSEICKDLVECANQNGGHDNITVICLKVTEEDVHEQ